ncbi:MAG: ParB/RepB/Spo0J family partition protein [Spirochaetia bacterium]|nr:ParB/RepB/Spo0J family partition protein [Spirochaetia bacterium]
MALRKSLGKGLSALIGSTDAATENQIHQIRIDDIRPNPNQTRIYFDKEKLQELSESLIDVGMIEPVIVVEKGGTYELIAGERRWRAAKEAGFKTIPAIFKNSAEDKALEIMLIENIQREDLSPIEEAMSYELLLRKKDLTHEALAKAIGKSRSHITNLLRILKLPDRVRGMINSKKISMGQAKMLVGLEEKDQERLVQQILKDGLSVREVEVAASGKKANVSRGTIHPKGKTEARKNHPDYQDVEKRLQDHLQTKVRVRLQKKNSGKIEIEFYSAGDLSHILTKLKVP